VCGTGNTEAVIIFHPLFRFMILCRNDDKLLCEVRSAVFAASHENRTVRCRFISGIDGRAGQDIPKDGRDQEEKIQTCGNRPPEKRPAESPLISHPHDFTQKASPHAFILKQRINNRFACFRNRFCLENKYAGGGKYKIMKTEHEDVL
jgi:hypothetical protein